MKSKKLLVIALSSTLFLSTLGTTYASASTSASASKLEEKSNQKTILQEVDTNIGINQDQTKYLNSEENTSITPMYIPGKFWGELLKAVLGEVVKTIVTDNFTVFTNFLSSSVGKWGGDKNGDAYVKVNDHRFTANVSSNMVGDGKANQSARVKDLQAALYNLGYNVGTIDGIWGPKTKSALIKFQQNKGLVADGICGVNTWRALAVK
ncbi:peptidoglycan-binding domain-containing protein [Niallia sp. MER TA 168]|uniref:peptidoglycan-binding domain-containing protein n=1 Tax=Niallia sp. MER TA 168 TaxID=2939568 RepID=UPI002040378E|nr:peptidoglycan-binding domain-containing protein [Niallia sp. MER TA 168]MCM3362014.1 peptidoglycan-binding protein [Niallia sp. MER TA 168]